MIRERIPGRSHGERQLVWRERMPGVRPHLATRMRGWQRINSQVQNAWNFSGTLLSFDAERDRNFLEPEVSADERRERRHGPAGRAGENCAQRLGLFVVCTLI